MRVGLGDDAPTFHCRIRGQNLYWAINGTLLVSSTVPMFRNEGITGSRSTYDGDEVTSSITVDVARATNNNTVLICKAQASGETTVSSNSTSVFITGNNHCYYTMHI